MTATIRPPANAPGVTRLDPWVRLSDYEQALAFYLPFLGYGLDAICFAENSGFDLGTLKALATRAGASKKVLFTNQAELDFPPQYGRCYGEAALLDRAMDELSDQPGAADALFWKVTGRYKVLNLQRMMRTRPSTADLYVDLRKRGLQNWADLRIMSWSLKGYNSVIRDMAPLIREDLNDGRPGEEAAYQVMRQRIARRELQAAVSFATEPLIDGVRAFDERNWMAGRQRAVYYMRNLQRALLGRVLV
ncbi:hypothetical protein M9978_10335 [Sphingomonas sp. MG17]|uniref:Uncharacterized protein n=1 Tax=Sphingomonas tagetis TaxID=2949092 RepID=A0A9X2KLP2_9SPHN|nr:hypothetical protein [Sphingomonas tagetis]MCP3730827.1 hypothetical protein [Sphingomonas tagetis]